MKAVTDRRYVVHGAVILQLARGKGSQKSIVYRFVSIKLTCKLRRLSIADAVLMEGGAASGADAVVTPPFVNVTPPDRYSHVSDERKRCLSLKFYETQANFYF